LYQAALNLWGMAALALAASGYPHRITGLVIQALEYNKTLSVHQCRDVKLVDFPDEGTKQ